jgi:RNA-dependent RNA polymerase
MAPEDTFSCYHVSVTPTAMKFNGPFPERSNRVFRRYPNRHSCFIRVTFEEETRLQLRFDREVDGATFVKKRYGTILRETGLKICGRNIVPCLLTIGSQGAFRLVHAPVQDEDGT